MNGHARVLAVEDDPRIAEVVCATLAKAGFAPVAVAHTAHQAETCIRALRPELLLVDLGLPDGDGADLILRARRDLQFDAAILVLTSACAPERVLAALEAGADGYLFKEDLNRRLATALHEVVNGGLALSRGAAQAVLTRLRQSLGPRQQALTPVLTRRERDVLALLSTGAKYAEIGSELGIGTNTVRTHIRSLYDKCGVQNGAEAVSMAWSLGLIPK